MAARARARCMAAGADCAHRLRQDGRGDARLGRPPAAESRPHAPPTRLVPADADARRADRPCGRGVVRQAGGRSGRRGPAPAAGRCARAHGRRGRRRLAGQAGAPGRARGHPGHALEPGADARLRLVPGELANGVRPPARRRAVGIRRGAAHGSRPRDIRTARSISPIGRGSSPARTPPDGKSCPQPLESRPPSIRSGSPPSIIPHRLLHRSSGSIRRRRRTAGSHVSHAPPRD